MCLNLLKEYVKHVFKADHIKKVAAAYNMTLKKTAKFSCDVSLYTLCHLVFIRIHAVKNIFYSGVLGCQLSLVLVEIQYFNPELDKFFLNL